MTEKKAFSVWSVPASSKEQDGLSEKRDDRRAGCAARAGLEVLPLALLSLRKLLAT